jgi:hypothetical protein
MQLESKVIKNVIKIYNYYETRNFSVFSVYQDGALRMKPVKQPDRTPAKGMVAIQLENVSNERQEKSEGTRLTQQIF